MALGLSEDIRFQHIQASILTVERAAAAKIYLETELHEKLNKADPRNVRRQYLETQLYYDQSLNRDQQDSAWQSLSGRESWHTRETRVLKAKSQAAGRGDGIGVFEENYEALKILGKGSFGVVKLVQEKSPLGDEFPKQVFAMKVIRKSDMLRSNQEGHLRAERDFLVASEGSKWYVTSSIQDKMILLT